jgi:hypothetical protein
MAAEQQGVVGAVAKIGEGPPTLNTEETAGEERTLTLAFGYLGDEPTAALFVGDNLEPILLPREFLQLAIEQGWEMQS